MHVGRDNSVGIATRYGLDCPGIETRWRRDFPHRSRPALGAHPASYTMGNGSFPEVKRPGGGVDLPPIHPSSAEVKERVEIYLYSTSAPSWPFIGWTLLQCTVHSNRHIDHSLQLPRRQSDPNKGEQSGSSASVTCTAVSNSEFRLRNGIIWRKRQIISCRPR